MTIERGDRAHVGLACWWLLLLSPLAASTLMLRVAVYWPLSFDAASKILLIFAPLFALALGLCVRRQLADGWRVAWNTDRLALWMALFAMVLLVLTTCCLHRPDADDAV